MQIVGIIGGIASGKSWVAEQLEQRGAGRIDADRAGHEALADPEVVAAARERWGDDIVDADGIIDRRRLAEIVFAPTPEGREELRYLEGLTHPRITRIMEDRLRELEAAGKSVVVIDAPLLLEAGWASLCSRVVWVEATDSVRLARAFERGWSERQFRDREAAQESLDSKRRRADTIIDNSGDLDRTMRRIDTLWTALTTIDHP